MKKSIDISNVPFETGRRETRIPSLQKDGRPIEGSGLSRVFGPYNETKRLINSFEWCAYYISRDREGGDFDCLLPEKGYILPAGEKVTIVQTNGKEFSNSAPSSLQHGM